MKNVKIFLSEEEEFIESVEKIKYGSKLNIETIYIEEFVKKKEYHLICGNDIVYFLCNSILILSVINIIKNTNCFIINKDFYMKNYNKKHIQYVLNKGDIKTPRIISYENFEVSCFPLFCKSKKHAHITFQAYNKKTLFYFFEKFDKKDFYFESSIIGVEYKIYYINGQIFSKTNINIDDKIKTICLKISEILNLIAFSADFIENLGQIFVIDVNPAPGFYLSDNARRSFIKYLGEQI